jgi:acyl carrier protein
MTELESRLYALLADQLGIAITDITATSSLSLELGADSMELIAIAGEIEEEFEITIQDEELEKVRTVEELCELVKSKVGATK